MPEAGQCGIQPPRSDIASASATASATAIRVRKSTSSAPATTSTSNPIQSAASRRRDSHQASAPIA